MRPVGVQRSTGTAVHPDRVVVPLDQPLYALDIETTGLSWSTDRITSVAIYGDGVALVVEDANEARLICQVRDFLANLEPGVIVTWNGATFDWPFLAGRSTVAKLSDWLHLSRNEAIVPKYAPQVGYDRVGYDGHPPSRDPSQAHRHCDVAYAWQDRVEASGCSWGLKAVARSVGLRVIEVDRAHMDELTPAERCAYNLSDVYATFELAKLVGGG